MVQLLVLVEPAKFKMKRKRRKISIEIRLWNKIKKAGPDDCWKWKGCCNDKGYGQLGSGGREGKTIYAHRTIFELEIGPIPEGLFVCHHCDNRKCCNPKHLFLGTNQDNVDDMVSKNRQAKIKGVLHGSSKLTEEQVLKIRLDLRSTRKIANDYCISHGQAWRVKTKKDWKHL